MNNYIVEDKNEWTFHPQDYYQNAGINYELPD